MSEAGLSDGELLKRLSAIYSEAFVAAVAKELADASTMIYVNETGLDEAVQLGAEVEIHLLTQLLASGGAPILFRKF